MKTPSLSVIIPYLNEPLLPRMLEDIFATAPMDDIEIICVQDDPGAMPDYLTPFIGRQGMRFTRTPRRLGVDACRMVGAEAAKADKLAIFDAHMRFQPGWSETMLAKLVERPKAVYCTTCASFGHGVAEWDQVVTRYTGASLLLTNDPTNSTTRLPDGSQKAAREVLEPKWLTAEQVAAIRERSTDEDDFQVPVVLGANYFVNKAWFAHIHGVLGLLMWGSSEPFLSMKSWMAGGECRCCSSVEIGHEFRSHASYSTGVPYLLYNKLLILSLLFDGTRAALLASQLPQGGDLEEAYRMLDKSAPFIMQERAYLRRIGIDDLELDRYLSRFDVAH